MYTKNRNNLLKLVPENLHIKSNTVFIGAVIGALISNAFIVVDAKFVENAFIHYLPLFSTGFGWLIPTILGGLIGWACGRNRDDRQELKIWRYTYGDLKEYEKEQETLMLANCNNEQAKTKNSNNKTDTK